MSKSLDNILTLEESSSVIDHCDRFLTADKTFVSDKTLEHVENSIQNLKGEIKLLNSACEKINAQLVKQEKEETEKDPQYMRTVITPYGKNTLLNQIYIPKSEKGWETRISWETKFDENDNPTNKRVCVQRCNREKGILTKLVED